MKFTKDNLILMGVIVTLVGVMYTNIIKGIDRNYDKSQANFDLISGISARVGDLE